MPLKALVQALPSQWRIVLPSPTAQASLDPLPQTLKREFPWGKGFRQHQLSALQTSAALTKFQPVNARLTIPRTTSLAANAVLLFMMSSPLCGCRDLRWMLRVKSRVLDRIGGVFQALVVIAGRG